MREDAIYRVVGALEADPQPLSAADAARLAAAAKMRAGLTGAKPRRWKLVLVAAAMLALAACAVVGFSSGWFASYTPPGDPQQANELLAEIGTPIGEKRRRGITPLLCWARSATDMTWWSPFRCAGRGKPPLRRS